MGFYRGLLKKAYMLLRRRHWKRVLFFSWAGKLLQQRKRAGGQSLCFEDGNGGRRCRLKRNFPFHPLKVHWNEMTRDRLTRKQKKPTHVFNIHHRRVIT
jgi:hypothetical protein